MNQALLRATVCSLLVASLTAAAHASPVSAKGKALAALLDAADVEHHWPAGEHVDWETGVPDGKPETTPGRHTHCSAFVASFAKRLGIYILRPPAHGQILLANAQYDWLGGPTGVEKGWQPVANGVEAQERANRGELVVAVYHNHHDDKPGHIAIIRPSNRGAAEIRAEGPAITQAGTLNYSGTTLKQGFAGHPSAFSRGEILFFWHAIESGKLN